MALTLVTSDLIGGLDYSKLTGTVPTWNQNTTGSAATLTTARNIGGVSFNGSAAINLPGVNAAGNQNTSGNAGTVTNGVYTVGNQTIGGVKTFSSNTTFSGSVGIGSTGIFAGTNAILNLQGIGIALKNDKNGSNNNWSYIQNTGTGSNSDINFYTGNNASALNLSHSGDATFSGNVEIDTNGGDGALGGTLKLSSTNTNVSARNWALINTWDNYGDLTFRVGNAQGDNPLTSGSTKMVINSGGNVGIGTTSPGASKLTISDGVAGYSTANVLLQVKRNATNSNDDTSRSAIMLANNSNAFTIAYGGATDRLRFINGSGNEQLTLLNGGNLGIGTTSPNYLS